VHGQLNIRRELRAGDLERIVSMHARIYGRENGVDQRFVEKVAGAVELAARRGFPGRRERIWIVERDGVFSGSLALTDEGAGLAMVRWFVLEPSLRGNGLGRRLLGELLAEAEAAGYSRVCLETFSELRAAAHLYRAHGFEVVGADTAPRWGRDEITYQRYELELRERDRHAPGVPAEGAQSTSTTAPPRRGSPPPLSVPSGSRATACTPPK
jgi:N-acetylglutamate synthase-like GNAT family acetyltransferase